MQQSRTSRGKTPLSSVVRRGRFIFLGRTDPALHFLLPPGKRTKLRPQLINDALLGNKHVVQRLYRIVLESQTGFEVGDASFHIHCVTPQN